MSSIEVGTEGIRAPADLGEPPLYRAGCVAWHEANSGFDPSSRERMDCGSIRWRITGWPRRSALDCRSQGAPSGNDNIWNTRPDHPALASSLNAPNHAFPLALPDARRFGCARSGSTRPRRSATGRRRRAQRSSISATCRSTRSTSSSARTTTSSTRASPAYRREDLHQAQTIDKSVFEYWTHALAYVPTRDIRFFLRKCATIGELASLVQPVANESRSSKSARAAAQGGRAHRSATSTTTCWSRRSISGRAENLPSARCSSPSIAAM